MWIKSNPNLGVSLLANYLADQIKDAKNRPEAVRNVMTKNVNLWVDAEKTWILDDAWMKCVGTMSLDDLKGCACWGGLDLSNVSDITAYVLIFHENDHFQLLPFFWRRCWRKSARRISTTTSGWSAAMWPSRPAT